MIGGINSFKAHLAKLCKLFVVVQEERQILVGNIDLGITSETAMLFFSLLSSRESVGINLLFDLVRLVGHENACIGIARAHFRLRTLKGREEFRVDERWFGVLELLRDITGQAEVRILVDSTRDEAWNVGSCAIDVGEGVGEGGSRLNSCKVHFSDVIPWTRFMSKIKAWWGSKPTIR